MSSTFTDLREERAEVIQALWELDCIPTGMEAFVASNESQWDVIKRVIDECDYYVLIIGGRYGSITAEGMSYTEKEYHYARKIGIPVLAFVHENPDKIELGKSEKDADLQLKLSALRADVMKQYPVRTWQSPVDLGALVSRSLVREIKLNPRQGWIRNDGNSPIALLEQVSKLTDENQKLRDSAKDTTTYYEIEDLESGSDEFELYGERTEGSYLDSEKTEWHVLVSWDTMFQDIAASMIGEESEAVLRDRLSRFHILDEPDDEVRYEKIAAECWDAIVVQFRALGLIDQGTKKRGVNDRNSYWKLTDKGDRHLVKLLARKRKKS